MPTVSQEDLVLIVVPFLHLWFVLVTIEMIRYYRRTPRIVSRSLPRIGGNGAAGGPATVQVGGRTYIVEASARPASGAEQCTWCLGLVDPAGGEDVVRCGHPQCRRISHRRHVEEFGGCGGICALL